MHNGYLNISVLAYTHRGQPCSLNCQLKAVVRWPCPGMCWVWQPPSQGSCWQSHGGVLPCDETDRAPTVFVSNFNTHPVDLGRICRTTEHNVTPDQYTSL